LSKGSRRRVLRESAGARSHVDANPEAHGMLYIRVSQLNVSNDQYWLPFQSMRSLQKLEKFIMTLFESIALKYRDKIQVHELLFPCNLRCVLEQRH